MKAGLFLGAILLLILGILQIFPGILSPTASEEAAAMGSPAPAPVGPVTPTGEVAGARAAPPPGPFPTATLSATPTRAPLGAELERQVADLDGTYGVAVLDLKDGQTVLINADHVFPSASLYKLLVMYRVFQEMEKGGLSLSSGITYRVSDMEEAEPGESVGPGDVTTVEDALEAMITASSNPAAYALARNAGGWAHVMAAAPELGMKDTRFSGDLVVSTPTDMMTFFALLAKDSLVSPAASEAMTAILLRQQINDRLPADLPEGTKVAHKTGELAEVRNDGGIVFTSRGPYVIVIMSEGIDPDKAIPAQARISRMVFDWFTQ